MSGERMRVEAKYLGNAWECRGIQGNTGEFQGNAWEWVQSARGMQGMQENARGTYGSECKVPGECRGMTRESTGVGVKC